LITGISTPSARLSAISPLRWRRRQCLLRKNAAGSGAASCLLDTLNALLTQDSQPPVMVRQTAQILVPPVIFCLNLD
jgi:hypothetical protein